VSFSRRRASIATLLPVFQRRVGAQRAKERLLERVVRRIAPEQSPELPQHGVLVLLVEPFERRYGHGFHHRYKRAAAQRREMWVSGVAEW
jgi:hypothetical protein